MVPQNQSTLFTNHRERGIIKQKEQKNHDTKDIHSGIQDEACPWGNPLGIATRGNSSGERDQPEYASELEAGVPEERFERILPEGIKGGKTRRTEEGGSPGEGKDQYAEGTLKRLFSCGKVHKSKPFPHENYKPFSLSLKIGPLTLERDFLQDCLRACDLPIPEYDKSEG